ncbi:hypothetical protein M422DRAFT_780281 [Sphaerobolus stellatus SS14]|uniref:Cytochrome P450 n=1 Tax=Sphaerobolus stellatus (strain SS14) TaxID=990650 RepID=A0A0C9UET4_SPHS4|nr:hypothetical protein M422DRAFT_780281 [Sphaerobolus stellatus SS14]
MPPAQSIPFWQSLTVSSTKSLGIVAIIALVVLYSLPWLHKQRLLASIPAIGPTNPISFYRFRTSTFHANARAIVEEAARKHRIFRVPQVYGWHIVVSEKQYIDDLRKAPDDYATFSDAMEEMMLVRYLLGPTLNKNHYTTEIIKHQLARNLPNLFPDIREETLVAVENKIPLTEDWIKLPAYGIVVQIIAQITNRILVGVPLCRNKDFLNLNIGFTMEVNTGKRKLQQYPDLLRPLVAKYFTSVPQRIEQALQFLRPFIEEKEQKLKDYGKDYPDKAETFLSWIVDEAQGEERSPIKLTNRILMLNFGAIHTSSSTFTHALYELAARPQYIPALREEVETVVKRYGWSKMALIHMNKLDSLFKETQRLNGHGCLSVTRMALKEFIFSDGTRIPKGTIMSAASAIPHLNDEVYPDPKTFDPFRFAKIREKEGQGTSNQFVATNNDYLAFGHGKHACPGRFFAANELKLMMAHIISTYDIKLEQDGVKPPNQWFGLSCMPNPRGSILFRRRRD